MLTRLEIPPPPSFPPVRFESGRLDLARTGAKSTQGELTASATTGDAACPYPRAGASWNPSDGDRPRSSVVLTGFKPRNSLRKRDCSIATGADSKIARQEQGESTWDPLNASELAPNLSDSVSEGATISVQWEPPDRLRRESFEGARKEG